MTAYALFIREKPIHDAAEMAQYNEKVRAGTPDPKLTPLVAYGAMQALEGEAPDGIVLLQFPTVEDAQAWYHSPRYQEAMAHRLKGANYRVVIVQGL